MSVRTKHGRVGSIAYLRHAQGLYMYPYAVPAVQGGFEAASTHVLGVLATSSVAELHRTIPMLIRYLGLNGTRWEARLMEARVLAQSTLVIHILAV